MIKLTLAIFLVLAVNKSASSRLIGDTSLISDGVSNATAARFGASMVTCKPPYGFLPCTTEFRGLVFLVFAYHYLLSLGQKYVSDGSDLFIRTFGPGVLGDNLFNVLGTIPQLALIISSRLSGDTENVKAKSALGINILAGGAILNLTFIWGAVTFLGRRKFETTSTSYFEPSSLTGTGVTNYDDDTKIMAVVMHASVMPLLGLLLANFVSSFWAHLLLIYCLIVTSVQLPMYYLIQYFNSSECNGRYDYLEMANDTRIKRVLQGLQNIRDDSVREQLRNILTPVTQPEDEVTSQVDVKWKNYIKAAFSITCGIGISCLLAEPLIESVVAVATASSIPPFLIPFLVIPFSLTIRSAGKMISSAMKKTPESISLTLSQIYASVFVSNAMGLFVISIVVFVRGIPVASSAELLVLTIIWAVMGQFTSSATTFPLWTSCVAMLMYPISLFTIYVLTTTFGWS